VNTPGIISTAYSRFWNYSVGNQILALLQCLLRGIEPGPIHTFKGWIDLGRHVRAGEKAITLCAPRTVKRKGKKAPANTGVAATDGDGSDQSVRDQTYTVFTYRAQWFVLSQTDGEPYQPQELPDWNEALALLCLTIERVPFTNTNGNCQGYARERSVSVSPIAVLPHKTLFHELAHVVLGHTTEGGTPDDDERTPVNLREVEAECVALICCESLNLKGAPESRGYIQHWLGKQEIPAASVQRIFKAADQILKAGTPSCTA
jgi:antirestriction protein ArdC